MHAWFLVLSHEVQFDAGQTVVSQQLCNQVEFVMSGPGKCPVVSAAGLQRLACVVFILLAMVGIHLAWSPRHPARAQAQQRRVEASAGDPILRRLDHTRMKVFGVRAERSDVPEFLASPAEGTDAVQNVSAVIAVNQLKRGFLSRHEDISFSLSDRQQRALSFPAMSVAVDMGTAGV